MQRAPLHRWLAASVVVLAGACGYGSEAAFGDPAAGPNGPPGSAPTLPRQDASVPPPDAPPPATCNDGLQNGSEADVDCGGSCPTACAVGARCAVHADCIEGVCAAGSCAAPTATDGVKNGGETDVDCGGLRADSPRCSAGLACLAHEDCSSDGCDPVSAHCAERRSCATHFGGDTCGPGEMDDPAEQQQHESCCRELQLPSGVWLDKYIITAGRMRAFLERVNFNPRAWVEANKPAWWADYPTDRLPVDFAGVATELSHQPTEGYTPAGCYMRGPGARTFWLPDDVNVAFGDDPHVYPQEIYDIKALNCVRRAMAAALCAFDGKEVADQAEYLEAWGPGTYPWGETEWNPTLVVHGYSYYWPANPPAEQAERSYHIAAPGRRPLGNGPFGHSDLAGNLYAVLWTDSIVTGSFELHRITKTSNPWNETTKYWAGGFRCARRTAP